MKRAEVPAQSKEPPAVVFPGNQFPSMTNGDIWVIDTVVIDPGHGGKDPGAVGPKGTKEKDIVLDIGREIKKIADSRGEIKVVMTREKDEFISLWGRAKTARDAHGKVFISIHANSNKNRPNSKSSVPKPAAVATTKASRKASGAKRSASAKPH